MRNRQGQINVKKVKDKISTFSELHTKQSTEHTKTIDNIIRGRINYIYLRLLG